MDNHKSHLSKELIDYAKSENIELLCLPAHSTHLLQPLDVGFYYMFKINGDWDCVEAVERLHALHFSVDFIFLSFGIMGFIVEL